MKEEKNSNQELSGKNENEGEESKSLENLKSKHCRNWIEVLIPNSAFYSVGTVRNSLSQKYLYLNNVSA